jgi:hypothetical protein
VTGRDAVRWEGCGELLSSRILYDWGWTRGAYAPMRECGVELNRYAVALNPQSQTFPSTVSTIQLHFPLFSRVK